MTRPNAPSAPPAPSAKAIARELDRRHRRRRLVVLGGFLALAVLAFLYARCGSGWGLGGGGGGGTGAGSASARAALPRCAVRVTPKGLERDHKASTREAIVHDCPQGVDVVVTGNARQGDWDELRRALDAAHIPVFTR